MKIFRSHKISVKIQKPDAVRAFVFDVQAGISKKEPAVDPMSGMLLNLVKIDQAFSALKKLWQTRSWNSISDLLNESQMFLQNAFQKEEAFLTDLILREERKVWVAWRAGRFLMGAEKVFEIQQELFKIQWEKVFREDLWQTQNLVLSEFPRAENIFKAHKDLKCMDLENLMSGEKLRFRKV